MSHYYGQSHWDTRNAIRAGFKRDLLAADTDRLLKGVAMAAACMVIREREAKR